jgi:hypothetical protein
MSQFIKCPSGLLSGEVRGLAGKDARLLSDRAAIKSGVFMDRIYDKCWVQTTEDGYGFGDRPDWSKALVGDRFYLLLRIRAQMFGEDFQFMVQCKDQNCRHRFQHGVKLDELPIKELSEEDREGFKNGNRLQGTLPDGKSFTFKLPTGEDEARFTKLGAAAVSSFIGPMVARIHEVEGLEEKDKRRYFEEEDLSISFDTLAEMDAHDCGVETTITVECPNCFGVADIEIPFGDGFLARKTLKPAR